MQKALILALMLLAGCALETANEKREQTTFKPTPGGFEYRGYAYGLEPLDSESGEAWRMGILQEYLTDNAVCPGGYEITSRAPVHISGPAYHVYYTGRCT